MKIKTSIIIINYNGEKIIADCLNSIINHKTKYSYEIIIIDNNSQDQSLKIINTCLYDRVCCKMSKKPKVNELVNEDFQRSFGDASKQKCHFATEPDTNAPFKNFHIIQNTANLGFSKANNQGLAVAQGEYIFLLNNDTVLLENVLDGLIEYLEENKNVGAVSPKLLNKDKTLQYQGSILGKWQFQGTKPKFLNFISGAAFFTRSSLLKKIGGLDENFFFYNEDIDLCKNIKKADFKIAYLPEIEVIHYGGISTKTRKTEAIIEGYCGTLYLVYKHYGKILYTMYKSLFLLYLIINFFIWPKQKKLTIIKTILAYKINRIKK